MDYFCLEDLAWPLVPDPTRFEAGCPRLPSDPQVPLEQEPWFHCFHRAHYGGCDESNKHETITTR
jgi:hypothetical protein